MCAPKISVIVLSYNQEDTIERALRSVAERCSGLDYEIIVGDDASTDSTREVCLRFAAGNPRVRVMPYAPNKGIVMNYFDCIAEARGEYLGDCAGDDMWLDEAPLGEALRMLDENPDLTAVFSDTETAAGSPARISRNVPRYAPGIIPGARIMADNMNHINALPYMLSAAIYRKSAIEAVMKRRRDIVCMPDTGIEDLPVIAALASQGDAAYLPGAALRYFVGDGSISNNPDPCRQTRFYCNSLECTRRLCLYYGIPFENVAAMFRHKAKYVAGMAWQSRRRELLTLVSDTLDRWPLPRPVSAKVRMAQLRLFGH
ncbi:MAG: glycosyltransferase family 2 protein [Muribaculaceae bacterium]|nr:glycosyltransferase family 2 protein [Muribaculaceae bacterium]